jgi:hypothetical protein
MSRVSSILASVSQNNLDVFSGVHLAQYIFNVVRFIQCRNDHGNARKRIGWVARHRESLFLHITYFLIQNILSFEVFGYSEPKKKKYSGQKEVFWVGEGSSQKDKSYKARENADKGSKGEVSLAEITGTGKVAYDIKRKVEESHKENSHETVFPKFAFCKKDNFTFGSYFTHKVFAEITAYQKSEIGAKVFANDSVEDSIPGAKNGSGSGGEYSGREKGEGADGVDENIEDGSPHTETLEK